LFFFLVIFLFLSGLDLTMQVCPCLENPEWTIRS
jgi:hypothetical protein